MDVELEHTFGPEGVKTFAELSGDDNPIHLDHVYATKQVWVGGWVGELERGAIHGWMVPAGDRRDSLSTQSITPTTTTIPHTRTQGIFKGAIVHGLLVGSLFGTIFGVTFPGCVYLQQSFKARIYKCVS